MYYLYSDIIIYLMEWACNYASNNGNETTTFRSSYFSAHQTVSGGTSPSASQRWGSSVFETAESNYLTSKTADF